MLEILRKVVDRKADSERVVSPQAQYFIRIQDGDRFWVSEEDYHHFWKYASMLEMKRLTLGEGADRKILAVIAAREFQAPWQESGKFSQMKDEGTQFVFTEQDKILETPFPQLIQ